MLALLPVPRRREALVFSHLPWLPADRAGAALGWACRLLAALAMVATALAVAGPGKRPEISVQRTGHGAEIVLLIDRSRSMDERMVPADWRTIDPLNLRLQAAPRDSPRARSPASCWRASSPSGGTTASP